MSSVNHRKGKRVAVGAVLYAAVLSLAGVCVVCLCTVGRARVSPSAAEGAPAPAESARSRRSVPAPTRPRKKDSNSNKGGNSNSNANGNGASGKANDSQDSGAGGNDNGNKNQPKPAEGTVSLTLSATAGDKEKKEGEDPVAAGALDRSVHETHYVRLFFLRKASDIAEAINKTKKLSADVKAMDNSLLFFPSAGGADDEAIHEFKRWISLIDVPRPEISLMTWSVQISSGDLDTINRESVRIRSAVSGFNDRLQSALEQGWWFLEGSRRQYEDSKKKFYAENLNNYLSDRYLWTKTGAFSAAPQNAPQPPCWSVLRQPPSYLTASSPWGADRYCLGYTRILKPIQPSLTSMLLALIAAQPDGSLDNAGELRDEFVNCLENRANCRLYNHSDGQEKEMSRPVRPQGVVRKGISTPEGAGSKREWMRSTETLQDYYRNLYDFKLDEAEIRKLNTLEESTCEINDRKFLLHQRAPEAGQGQGAEKNGGQDAKQNDEVPAFSCFREQLQRSMDSGRLGDLRRTLAEFLFQYKSAEYYPRDFVAWNQAASSQALDANLDPLISAFNRDLNVYLRYIQEDVQSKHGTEKKATFESDGIVTALVISGNAAQVDTTTQSFFKQPPTLNVRDVVSALEGSTKPSLAPIAAGNGAELIAAAIQAEQRTVAKVGRNLNINITSNTLKGASACEMDVSLDSTEADKPTMLGAGGTGTPPEDNLSRVATHNTNTKVRVDSTKLFEVSSFAAALVHGRSIPLIPPGVDLPYIGSIARLRLKPGTVYHRSFAIVSAVIVPTAADLANMIEFNEDLKEQQVNTFGELQLIGAPVVKPTPPAGQAQEQKASKKPKPAQKLPTAPVYYWIVTHYLDGDSVSGPFRVSNAPATIDADHTVTLAWRAPERALSFDVIRTTDGRPDFDTAAHQKLLMLLIENTTNNSFTDDNNQPRDYPGPNDVPLASRKVLSRITRQSLNLRSFHKAMLDCIEEEARGSTDICSEARLSKQLSEGRDQ